MSFLSGIVNKIIVVLIACILYATVFLLTLIYGIINLCCNVIKKGAKI